MPIENSSTLAAGWNRLQAASIELAIHLHTGNCSCHVGAGQRRGGHIHVPEDIKENCEILGRGNEEEIKARIQWIAMYYPEVFNRSRRHMIPQKQETLGD